MNERRIIVTGAIGIALLVAVALVGIGLLGDRAAPTGSPAAPTGSSAAPAATLVPPPPPALVPSAAPAPAPDPAATAPPRSIAPAAVARPRPGTGVVAWESVDTALRPSGLGVDLAAPVASALADVRERMQPCFDEEATRLAHAAPREAKPGVYGPAVLVLRLEAHDGRLVVADTEVASEGMSSPQLVECCRRMLKAHEFEAPVAPPQRYKVQLPLQ